MSQIARRSGRPRCARHDNGVGAGLCALLLAATATSSTTATTVAPASAARGKQERQQ